MARIAARIRNDTAPAEAVRGPTRARQAAHGASVEDVDYQNLRGLDRALFLKFAACDQMEERSNILITGAAGLDKSWLACAFGHTACRENISVLR